MRDVDEVCFKDVFANFNPDVGSYRADGSGYDNPVRNITGLRRTKDGSG